MTQTDDQRQRTAILATLLTLAAPGPPAASNVRGALLRAIFAVGFGRVGDSSSELLASLRTELDELPPHVQALVRLYLEARRCFVEGATHATLDRARVEARLPLAPEQKRAVDFLVVRSLWLRPSGLVKRPAPEGSAPGLRPTLERMLRAAEASSVTAPTTIARVAEMPGLYDYEVREAVRRMIALTISTGDVELVRETMKAAHAAVARIRIWAHKLGAIAASADAATFVGDAPAAHDCASSLLQIVAGEQRQRMDDVGLAVQRVLAAVASAGGAAAARRLVDDLAKVAQTERWATAELSSIVSAAFHKVGDRESAEKANARALERARTTTKMEPQDRYDTGAGVLTAVKDWALGERAVWCARVMENLPVFTDLTVNRELYLYPTHELLLAELAVEAIVHDVVRPQEA